MSERRKKGIKKSLICLALFAGIFVGVFFGVQFITKTGVFRIPGVVYYGENLKEDELAKLHEIFT